MPDKRYHRSRNLGEFIGLSDYAIPFEQLTAEGFNFLEPVRHESIEHSDIVDGRWCYLLGENPSMHNSQFAAAERKAFNQEHWDHHVAVNCYRAQTARGA
jgi:hypothetical protein